MVYVDLRSCFDVIPAPTPPSILPLQRFLTQPKISRFQTTKTR